MALSKNKIKLYRSLYQKKYRDKENLYLAEGKKNVTEAIQNAPESIIEIICTEDFLHNTAITKGINVEVCNYNTISKISSLSTPQPIIAILQKPGFSNRFSGEVKDLTLVLEDIKDPGNLGTIIRLADWFGVEQVICSENCVDCYNPKVVQASMGSIFRMQLIYTGIASFIHMIREKGIEVYGTSLDGHDIFESEVAFPSVLVMGNESSGLSEEVKKAVTQNLLIPSFSKNNKKSESLNVSTATAIALSEFRRQCSYSK